MEPSASSEVSSCSAGQGKCPHFIERKGYSQQLETRPYPKPAESSPMLSMEKAM
jgi:hypothetical protein